MPTNSSALSNNSTLTNRKGISHKKTRLFRADKLKAPRAFQLPKFYKSSYLKEISPTEVSRTPSHAVQTSVAWQPLMVEIGAGKGKHACLYAEQNPQHNFIAIERTLEKYRAFSKMAERKALANLEAVHADAIPYCVHALLPNSVDTVFILYPNPELKNPNQQWLNMPFFEFLLSRLMKNGKVIIATNIERYIMDAEQQATDTWRLPTNLSQVPENSARTHFEIKYLQRGEVCWQLEIQKPPHYQTHFDLWQSPYLNGIN